MYPYVKINAHSIGKSHLQKGLVCEDYSASFSEEGLSIAVISDGHGDPNCFRSDVGARIACDVAISCCRLFYEEDYINRCSVDEFFNLLESEIDDEWKERVLWNARQKPFTEKELSGVSSQAEASYRAGKSMEKAYGCTLIVAAVTPSYWYGIQIGDGKCVAAFDDGVFIEPIPRDEKNCCGNRSTSLCNANARELFRHCFGRVLPNALFVVSDGIEESFDQNGFFNCLYSIAYWVNVYGHEEASQKIKQLLPQISEGGSGDDVSISALISREKSVLNPRQTLKQINEHVGTCESFLERCSSMIEKTESEFDESKKEELKYLNKISELEVKIKELNTAIYNVKISRQRITDQLDRLFAERKKIEEQIDKANRYKAAAEEYWREKYHALKIWSSDNAPENSDSLEKIKKDNAAEDGKEDGGSISGKCVNNESDAEKKENSDNKDTGDCAFTDKSGSLNSEDSAGDNTADREYKDVNNNAENKSQEKFSEGKTNESVLRGFERAEGKAEETVDNSHKEYCALQKKIQVDQSAGNTAEKNNGIHVHRVLEGKSAAEKEIAEPKACVQEKIWEYQEKDLPQRKTVSLEKAYLKYTTEELAGVSGNRYRKSSIQKGDGYEEIFSSLQKQELNKKRKVFKWGGNKRSK